MLVGMTGFEPAAFASRTQRSTKLSHIPKFVCSAINFATSTIIAFSIEKFKPFLSKSWSFFVQKKLGYTVSIDITIEALCHAFAAGVGKGAPRGKILLNHWILEKEDFANRTALDICKFSKKGGICVSSKKFSVTFLSLSADCWVMKSMKFAHICW